MHELLSMLSSVLLMVLTLSFLVLIHELGHFFAARKMGVDVDEFGIGYPPRLAKLFKWKETIFSLNWLPFGGFVKLAGDDAETFERTGDGAAVQQERVTDHAHKASRMFYHKSQLQRMIIVLAGATVNILFAILVFGATYTQLGIPTNLPYPMIDEVVEPSPAKAAGLKVGDLIYSLNDKDIHSSSELIAVIQQHRGNIVSLGVEHDGQRSMVRSYIRKESETPDGMGSLGVRLADTEYKHYPAWQMPFRGMVQGAKDSLAFSMQIPKALGGVVVDLVTKAKVSDDVSGPIGIVHMAQQEEIAQQGWLTIINFAAIISLNLGVMNVMPIPALDGGRAVFILLESVLGKRRRARVEVIVNNIGMGVLLLLIVLISLHDVWKIFVK